MAVRIESQAEPIPGYRLLERLGGGGFGEVWKAIAPGGMQKAIKFVYGDLEMADEEGQRAEQELKALKRVITVRHPYILSLERFEVINGQLIIVMELADRNLYDRFKECRGQGLPGIPRDELLDYMLETAEALDLMNIEYQLQHLDIKPQNLFLVYNHIKVADFGLVKDLEGMIGSVTGGVTPVYAAPETFDGWVSRFCDQYSLAIVYQEMLTGVRPFSGTNVRQLILQHLQSPPNLEPLPAVDRPIIARGLAKKPEERYPNCLEMVRALLAALEPEGPPAPLVPGEAVPEFRPAPLEGPFETEVPPRESDEPPPATVISPKAETGPAPKGESSGPLTPPGRSTRLIRAARKTSDTGPPRTPPPTGCGKGVLVPALVVGVGHYGRCALHKLQNQLQEQYGSAEALPNVRLLAVDTDPDAQRIPLAGKPDAALSGPEVLLTRLNRPSHYLKSREGLTRLDGWFNLKMLYRIPRSPATQGVRALGRLAFFDNYKAIAHRLRRELEDCTRPEALAEAERQTRLEIRGGAPRVYVVAGLAGGTGSGMFLDLAYVTRRILKELGHDNPEVVGLFLLPPAEEKARKKGMAQGNTFASLTELNHYSSPDTVFAARYEEREPPLQDAAPPYDRCVLLPLPEGRDEEARREAPGLAADFLFRELVTPLGRLAEAARACRPAPAAAEGLLCQTFGLYRLAWPKQAMIQRVARTLCRRLTERWMAKDGKPVRETVRLWVSEQWANEHFEAEHLIARLQQACTDHLGRPPEDIFVGIAERLSLVPGANDHPQPANLDEVTAALEHLFDRPGEDSGRTTPFLEALEAAAEQAVSDWGEKMAELAVRLIEQPEYRLAGAEESLRQAVTLIEKVLQHYEPLAKDLAARAAESYLRLREYSLNPPPAPPKGKPNAPLLKLVELLRVYPKWRYQGLILHNVIGTYVSLRGHLTDQLREVNYCRSRLDELTRRFADPAALPPFEARSARGRNMFPGQCRGLDEAVKLCLDTVSAEDFNTLDARVQAMIRQTFSALVRVCLESANLTKELEVAMQREAQAFVEERLGGTDVAEMFLAHYADLEDARAEMMTLYDEAAPDLPAPPGATSEVAVLALPATPAGDRFRDQARHALADVDLVYATSPSDIVFYREISHIPLAGLEHLGPAAQEAYRQMTATEHFTPHIRCDITDWLIPAADKVAGG